MRRRCQKLLDGRRKVRACIAAGRQCTKAGGHRGKHRFVLANGALLYL